MLGKPLIHEIANHLFEDYSDDWNSIYCAIVIATRLKTAEFFSKTYGEIVQQFILDNPELRQKFEDMFAEKFPGYLEGVSKTTDFFLELKHHVPEPSNN